MERENLNTTLQRFYEKSGFGNDLGKRQPLTVKVYTGCMLVPLPNIETRRKYLKYHDLHHLLTGYSVGRIGEGKTSSWELGTGTFFRYPTLGFMNLIALSTGLFLKRKDMWDAFLSGKKSRNLYSKEIRQLIETKDMTIEELRTIFLETKEHTPNILSKIEFGFYSVIALFIHAVLVTPAIILRTISDFISTGSLIETVKPKKRADLY